MDITAKLNYLRMSPRKARLVADSLRWLDVSEARTQLKFSNKMASEPIAKLLDSAIANAKNNFSKEEDRLYIKKIFVDKGPTYKRYRPRARGMTAPINKRTSHITVVLDERKKEEMKNKENKSEKKNKS